jgi:hypothetical protein
LLAPDKTRDMKKSNYFRCGLLIVALGFTIFAGCETTGSSASSSTTAAAPAGNASVATLVINRAANMGSGVFLHVSVDGKHVGLLSPGQRYNGSLSPGAHVVSVILEPNDLNLSPTKKSSNAQKGKTYTYTAMWDGNIVRLE